MPLSLFISKIVTANFIPLLCFSLHRLGLWLGAAIAHESIFSAVSFSRWDSGHYMWIARDGYQIEPCPAGFGVHPFVCGNGAWFPLYSYLLRYCRPIFGSLELSGVVLSAVFFYGMLFLTWNYILDRERSTRSILLVLMLTFFPGNVYYATVFPISLAGMLVLGALVAQKKSKFLNEIICCVLSTITYSTGFLISAATWIVKFGKEVLSKDVLRRPQLILRNRYHFLLIASLIGMSAVFFLMRLATGKWKFYFYCQANYRYSSKPPFATLLERSSALYQGNSFSLITAESLELHIVTFILLCVVWISMRMWRRFQDYERIAGLLTVLFWLVPVSLGAYTGLVRSTSLLVPALVLLRYAPTSLLLFLCIACATISPFIAALFFNFTLQ